MNVAVSPLQGTLRFIRYGFMPNRLQYCGGDDNRTLFEYGVENVVDEEITFLVEPRELLRRQRWHIIPPLARRI